MHELAQRRRLIFTVAALAGACATDTSGLARREPVGGESAGSGGAGAEGRGDAAPDRGAGSGGAARGGGSLGGEGSIAITHGIVDGGRLFACVSETTSPRTFRTERPIPEAGLGFGEAHRLPTDWELSRQEVVAELFVALPAQVAGLGCDALLESLAAPPASPPLTDAGRTSAVDAGTVGSVLPFPAEPAAPRRAGSVTFPPGALRAGSQYVLVSAGCATVGAQPVPEICGPPDPLFGGHHALVLAGYGSGEPVATDGNISLQFLNASRAVARSDLVLQGTSQRQLLAVANDVRFGSVRPPLPALVQEPAGLELHVDGAGTSSYTQAWASTFTQPDGDGPAATGAHLVVYVGPAPSVAASGFAPPRFMLIPEAQ